jgi:lipid-A-disaccharide synthase
MRSLFIFAGEPSGDLHGEKLVRALLAKKPDLEIWGVGGRRMRAAGVECVLPMEEFQVMGFIDVFLALPKLMRQFYLLRRQVLKKNPDTVLLIDYPGFNIRFAEHLRKKGYKGFLCHFICPSVWAWGKNRIPKMAKNLDTLFTILPFEKTYFSATSLKVHFVGHPLVKSILEPHKQDKVQQIGIFPGSRKKELERNFPIHLRVAKKLLAFHPNLQFTVSLSQPRFAPLLKTIMQKEGIEFPLEEQSYGLMEKSDLAIAKSGTVTLELALHKVPTVVTYGISAIDLFVAKNLLRIRLPYYCLVNILHSSEVFPELMGPNLTEEALFKKMQQFIEAADLRLACRKKCEEVRALLTEMNAAEEVAEEVVKKGFKLLKSSS